MVQSFYFSTGVKVMNPWAKPATDGRITENTYSLPGDVWGNAVGGGYIRQILILADVPEGAKFKFGACTDKVPCGDNMIVVKPLPGTNLLSEYLYFEISK